MVAQRAPYPASAAGAQALTGASADQPLFTLGLAERRTIRRAADVLIVAVPWLATAAAANRSLDLASGLTAAAAWLLTASIVDTYRAHRGARLSSIIVSSFVTLGLAAALFGIVALALPGSIHSATELGYPSDLALIALLLGAWQMLYSQVVQRPAWRRRAVILGANATARATARTLRRSLARDFSLVGFVAEPGEAPDVHFMDGTRVIGQAEDLASLLRTYQVNQIILANDDRLSGELVERLAEAREQGVEITTMFDLYRSVAGRLPMEDGPAFRLAALTVPTERALGLYELAKRALDIGIALIGLAGVGMLVPLITLANALEAPGPLFYSQTRVGRGGKTFKILKFRSMVVNAERPGLPQWARPNDRRVTRMGRLLRKTHLDEVPQLWNVLSGDMSFVGPRPERPELIGELRQHIACYTARHAVRPGLTGWAQINYPYGNTVRDALVKLEYDLYYIQHRGFWLDVLCILRTVRSVLMLTGI